MMMLLMMMTTVNGDDDDDDDDVDDCRRLAFVGSWPMFQLSPSVWLLLSFVCRRPSVCLPIRLSVCLSNISVRWHSSSHLFICLSVCLLSIWYFFSYCFFLLFLLFLFIVSCYLLVRLAVLLSSWIYRALFACLYVSLLIIWLFDFHLFICLSVCLPICLSFCSSVWHASFHVSTVLCLLVCESPILLSGMTVLIRLSVCWSLSVCLACLL